MIISETITIDGRELKHTYSDKGMKIIQETGAVYTEAIDVLSTTHTYVETNEPIEPEITDSQALNIIMGRDMNYGLPDGNVIPPEN